MKRRSRKEIQRDQQIHYDGLENETSLQAKKHFRAKPYQAKEIKRMDILTYIRQQAKGERGIGQKDS